jgi:hypothetical protein
MKHDANHDSRCSRSTGLTHAGISRRTAIQAGSIGLLGLGMNHVAGLEALARETASPAAQLSDSKSFKAVIYVFLSGCLAGALRGSNDGFAHSKHGHATCHTSWQFLGPGVAATRPLFEKLQGSLSETKKRIRNVMR